MDSEKTDDDENSKEALSSVGSEKQDGEAVKKKPSMVEEEKKSKRVKGPASTKVLQIFKKT